VKRPAVNNRQLFPKITMPGGTWNGPFQSGGVPWVVRGYPFACKDAHEEVEEEDQLSGPKNERGNGDKHVYRLLRHKEHVLRRVVDSAHLATDTQNVHRKENAVGTNESQPEMQLSKRLVHEPPEHFREPVVQTAESSK